MLKRQKIVLGYLLKSPRVPLRTEFFKMVFLLRQETILESEHSFYDFLPYHYGPYSFSLEKELDELRRIGYVNGNGLSVNRELTDEATQACSVLDSKTQQAIDFIIARYGCLTKDDLIHYVYKKYPWFATRSKLNTVPQTIPLKKNAIYTAGYEGISIDRFLQKLLKAGIERVIDVRYNPLSRKYGFSKKSLCAFCERFGLEYIHIPDLGIPPKLRRHLKTYDDYQKLLDEYESSILPEVSDFRLRAGRLMAEKPSVLVCFEADVRCCHRTRLAETITRDIGIEVLHL